MEKPFSEVPQFKDSRLPSLYSDYSHLKEINPEGYQANHDAWVALLDTSLRLHTFGSSITLPGSKLAAAFRNKVYGEPKSLAETLNQEIRKGTYVPLSIYKEHNVVTSRRVLDYFSPVKLAVGMWSLVKLSIYSLKQHLGVVPDAFIDRSRLVSVSTDIHTKLTLEVAQKGVISAKLFSEQLFADAVRRLNLHLSDEDVQAMMLYLCRDTGKIAILRDSADALAVYLKLGENETVTEDDVAVIKLKENIGSVAKRIAFLEEKLDREIPGRLSQLVKSQASEDRLKNVLIRKSALKKALSNSTNVHLQLVQVLDKIDEAKSNIALMETLQNSKSALALLNKQVSLDEVDTIAVELEGEMALTSEVSDALMLASGVDEEELENELAQLEKDEKISKPDTNKAESEDEELIDKLKHVTIDSKAPLNNSKSTDGVEATEEKRKIHSNEPELLNA